MASTLADLSKIEKDRLRKSVMDTMLMESVVMQHIPWETLNALGTVIVRFQDLPAVGFRKIGENYLESTGATEQISENVSLLGGMIDVDKALVRAGNTIERERAVQQRMKLKAMTYAFNDKFINGDRSSDPEEFDGLDRRCALIGSAQEIDYTSTTSATTSASDARAFINKIDELIYSIDGHQPDALYMNKTALLSLRSCLRLASLLDTSRDQFGRQISAYGGIPMYDIGVTANQTTKVILDTETKGGGSAETSIYAVKYGVGTDFWGIEEYPLDVVDKGELESGVTYRTVVDWPVGLAIANDRSIARLYGIIP